MIIRCDFCGTANSDRNTHCKSCGAALNLSNDFLEKQRNEVEKLNKIDSIADADVRKTKGITTAILAIIIGMPVLTFLGFAFIFTIIYVIDCAGVRVSEGNDSLFSFGRIFAHQAKASGIIPQISVICGSCGGGLAVAASMSESGKIGFVGGVNIPVINRFHAGFIAGAQAVNPDIEVQVNYTEAFDDASKGKIAANAMYSSGVDIIFHAAGGTGNGVFSEAKERKAKDANANIWVIGVDADQYAEGQVDPSTNVTLTSMLKGVNNAVVDIATRTQNGEFPGGETIVYGLAEDGVGLADSRGAIPQKVLDLVEDYKGKIAAGEIEVPEAVK